MGWKGGKNLANLLRKTAIASTIAMPLFFWGCEKSNEPPIEPPSDITSPKITIFSPLENKVYDSDTISFEWNIIEEHFKSAWYSIDNEQTKTPIVEKSGRKNLILPNGNYNLITYADDNSGNFSRENVLFSTNKIEKLIINPFIQPDDSTHNWYGSGNIDNDNLPLNKKDLDRFVEVISGTYSNPSDTRLYDRMDVNGDGTPNADDLQLLAKKVNGTRLYLPGEWNLLLTRAEREDWLRKMLAIDRTDKSPFPRGGCLYYSDQLMINFNGFGGKELLKLLKVYPYDTTYNCRFNMPVLEVGISAYDLNGTWIGGHSRNTIFLGDNALDWNDKSDIEPQNDSINVKTEQDPKYSINSIFYILNPGKEGEEAIYIRYDIKNNVPILKEINTNLITQRGK